MIIYNNNNIYNYITYCYVIYIYSYCHIIYIYILIYCHIIYIYCHMLYIYITYYVIYTICIHTYEHTGTRHQLSFFGRACKLIQSLQVPSVSAAEQQSTPELFVNHQLELTYKITNRNMGKSRKLALNNWRWVRVRQSITVSQYHLKWTCQTCQTAGNVQLFQIC